ncbi:MAG TPA: PAS domain-containing sensor histidine kinase [Gemmatimonadaceae bacterium]
MSTSSDEPVAGSTIAMADAAARPNGREDSRPADPGLDALRMRLQEAEETLRAIRLGEVDAVVVQGPDGPRTYTLVTADQVYRQLVEQMREGALTLSTAGVILYCNARFSALLGRPHASIAGRRLRELADAGDVDRLQTLLDAAATGSASGEVRLRRGDGTPIPMLLSLSVLRAEAFNGICAVATDLTDRDHREQQAADERLTRAILEHAAEAIVLCDADGRIARANRIAVELSGEDVVGRRFEEAFPVGITFAELTAPTHASLGERRDGSFVRGDGRRVHLLVGARPIGGEIDIDGDRWVVTLADVTARREAEAARDRLLQAERAARADAENASRAKSDFLAVMSHELRTPLNAIAGYAELMQLGVPEPVPEAHRPYLVRIQAAQRHLLALINNVLNLAKLERGHVEYQVEPVAVSELWTTVEALVSPQIHGKGLEYRSTPCDPSLVVMVDREKAVQILLNLIGNAVKFTPAGGRVTLDADHLGDRVSIRVRDSGIGIAPEKLASVFEPFVQIDRTVAGTREGVGLGLSISRELARGMGGDLTAQSVPGEGSEFCLVLPAGGTARE